MCSSTQPCVARLTGRITRLHGDGWGFIRTSQGDEYYAGRRETPKGLDCGDEVLFTPAPAPQEGKLPLAKDVQPV